MVGVSLLRWFSGGQPPSKTARKGRGSHGGHRPRVAAPPTPSLGEGAAAEGPASGAAQGEGAQQQQQPAGGQVALPLPGPLARMHTLLRAVVLPSLHLASRLLSRPWLPVQEELQATLAGLEAVKDTCRALACESLEDLQDVLASLVLSECVYKVLDLDSHHAVQAINNIKALFPPQLVPLRRVQWALPHAQHSFLMAEGDGALYVAFMGTKRPADFVTNVNLFQDQELFDAAASGGVEAGGAVPAAHRGFSSRAKAIPIEAIYHQARAQGKRLVLCGHSLGGAVAQLCAVRLLQQLPPAAHKTVLCVGFATPPIGNQALADMVSQKDWGKRLRNYLLPEDPIPRLLASPEPPTAAEEPAAAAPAGCVAAPAPLASVSVHSDAIAGEARQGPRLPAFRPSFWRRQGAAIPTAGTAMAANAIASIAGAEQAEEAANPGSGSGSSSGGSRGAAELLQPSEPPLASDASSAPRAAVGGQGTGGSPRGRTANNITAAPKIGIVRGSQVARAVAPVQAARSSSSSAEGGDAADASVDGVGLAELAMPAQAAALVVTVAPPNGSIDSAPDALAAPISSVEEAEPVAAVQRRWRRRWMVPRPPLQAVAQSAQAAARLMAVPLNAAAAMPMKVRPQYISLGQTLYVLPETVTTSRPPPAPRGSSSGGGSSKAPAALSHSRSAGALLPSAAIAAQDAAEPAAAAAPAPPPPARRFWRAASAPALQPAASASGASLDEASLDEELAGAASAAEAPARTLAQMELPPGTLFPHHRMLSYRNRMLGICKDSLRGRVWLPALPHFANVPHPDDVALTELLAPMVFPLKAEAALPASLAPGAAHAARAARAAMPAAAAASSAHHAHKKPAAEAAGAAAAGGKGHASGPLSSLSSLSSLDGGDAAAAARAAGPAGRHRRRWLLPVLFRRPGGGQEGGPVELEVRVEGRGLHTVTRAWVEGSLPPTSKDGADVMAAQIVWQPPAPAPGSVHRRPLAAMTPFGAFFSWVAVSMGWVTLLRRLQPAGKNDYLVARVTVPASVVKQAELAASNPLQAAVNDAHLPGVHVGPKLTVHLQSDFAEASIPLDIRAAADVDAQLGLGWRRLLQGKKWWE